MTPLTISISALRILISRATRGSATPQFPVASLSKDVIVPSLNWYKREWMNSWNQHRVENITGDHCETVVAAAVALMSEIAMEKSKKMNKDFSGSLFEARIHINKEPFMGCGKGSHCTTLAVYTEDHETAIVALYEPQAPNFLYEPLTRVGDRIDFSDCSS